MSAGVGEAGPGGGGDMASQGQAREKEVWDQIGVGGSLYLRLSRYFISQG